MGCTAARPQARVLPPPGVVKLVESLCSRFEPLEKGEKCVLGVDQAFQITLYLERNPSGCADLAQLFLQHLSPTTRESLLIVKADLCQSGNFEIRLLGASSLSTLRIFSEEFADPCDPIIEIWVESVAGPGKKIWRLGSLRS
jgi:hypothetical protein